MKKGRSKKDWNGEMKKRSREKGECKGEKGRQRSGIRKKYKRA